MVGSKHRRYVTYSLYQSLRYTLRWLAAYLLRVSGVSQPERIFRMLVDYSQVMITCSSSDSGTGKDLMRISTCFAFITRSAASSLLFARVRNVG